MMNGWTMGGWMWIWPVLVVFGLVILGYAGWRLMGNRQEPSTPGRDSAGSSARRILDERYARGEIGEEDYRRRRDELP
jgi:putative membrane protein